MLRVFCEGWILCSYALVPFCPALSFLVFRGRLPKVRHHKCPGFARQSLANLRDW
jgi:hypothetical protein